MGCGVVQEWERCRDAARIAEQGAELGATAENKVSASFHPFEALEIGETLGYVLFPPLFCTASLKTPAVLLKAMTYEKKCIINLVG